MVEVGGIPRGLGKVGYRAETCCDGVGGEGNFENITPDSTSKGVKKT